MTKRIPSPLEFFAHLYWLDGRPLLETIEPYRQQIFMEALYNWYGDGPRYNLVLTGRAKKNFKSTDLILAAFYRFLVWPSASGNDCFLLANDEGQAADDLELAKKLIEVNPVLKEDIEVRAKELVRRDGKGSLKILPAGDVTGLHGKTYLFIGFDEIHGYSNWNLFEALALDPTRPDALMWITSYASIDNHDGVPLHDLFVRGKAGSDPRMFFSWYAADFTTDPGFENADPEQRANPSMESWPEGREYLEQQKLRLPSHQYRRLHLNLPGPPDGAAFDADMIAAAMVRGRKRLDPEPDCRYSAFVDMSGGSVKDACLAIVHRDESTERIVVDVVVTQTGRPPFDPRQAVGKFAELCKRYHISKVHGDKYAGETFIEDFKGHGITYIPCKCAKHELYQAFEPLLNASALELLDQPKLQQQLTGLEWRGKKIDPRRGELDDWANAVAGAVWTVSKSRAGGPRIRAFPYLDPDETDPERKAKAWAREREAIAMRNSQGLSRPRSGLSYYTGGDFGDWIRRG